MVSKRLCRICKSEFRGEIEALLNKNVRSIDIATKYHKLFNIKIFSMYAKINNHIKRKHPPLIADMTPFNPGDRAEGTGISFEGYANRLLSFGMREEMFNDKKISHNTIISAQRTLIEKDKSNTQKDALRLQLVKFLRGKGDFQEIKEVTEI